MRTNLIISVPLYFLFLLVSCSPSTEELYAKAEKLQEQKKYKEAIGVYTKINKRNSKFQDAVFGKGYCYFLDSNYTKALDYYEYLLRLKGVDIRDSSILIQNVNIFESQEVSDHEVLLGKVYYHTGITEYFLNNLNSSYKFLQHAINDKYEEANCYLWQGMIWIKTDSTKKACNFFQKAKELGEAQADSMIKGYCQKSGR